MSNGNLQAKLMTIVTIADATGTTPKGSLLAPMPDDETSVTNSGQRVCKSAGMLSSSMLCSTDQERWTKRVPRKISPGLGLNQKLKQPILKHER